MVADWNDVTDANDTNMTAYIAYRLAQDGATVTRNQALTELLLKGGMPASTFSTSHETPGIKTHGNYFHIL